MFYLKKILAALVLPPFGLIVLAAIGLWVARRHPRLGHAIVAVAVAALAALSLPLVSDGLLRAVESRPPISARQLARAQAIVILGGGVTPAPEYGGDTVALPTLERVRYSAYLQRRTGLPILVTGGATGGRLSSAEAMKEAIERDFHGSVRWVENDSQDTAEDAAYSAVILKREGISRIALVTQAWHMPRAAELFERQGLEVFAAPTGFAPSAPLFWALLPEAGEGGRLALHEWLGMFVQRLAR